MEWSGKERGWEVGRLGGRESGSAREWLGEKEREQEQEQEKEWEWERNEATERTRARGREGNKEREEGGT